MKFKKKTILILGAIGLLVDATVFIFEPGSRIDMGIGIAVIAAVMYFVYKSNMA